MDTTNAVKVPTSKIIISFKVKVLPSKKNLSTYIPLSPTIAGTDKQNENSAASVRESPKSMAPKMVEPLLEVPGTNAKH